MKKIFFSLIIALFALILVGCESGKTDDKDDNNGGGNQTTMNGFDEKFNEISNELKNSIPYIVYDDISLIDYYEKYDAYIEWTSSNDELIDFTGGVDPSWSEAFEVTLTYNVTIDGESKSDTIDIIVSPESEEKIMERFAKQFSVIITRDYDVKYEYYKLFIVEWVSTNADVFTNEGKYIKPSVDTNFEIKYVLKCKEYASDERVIKLTAVGPTDFEKIEEISNWLKTEAMLDLYLTEEVSLPNKYEKLNVPITWESTNPDVVASDGTVTHYVFERYVTLIAKFDLGNGNSGVEKFECIVSALDTSEMTENEIVENFLSAIALTSYKGVKFGGNGSGCNPTYGHLNFYLNETSKIIQNLSPETNKNRTGISCDIKFVIVHDTGNMSAGANALANSNYCKNGSGGTSTGWHYTTGNDGIYQQIPDGEVAYHAHGGAYDYAEFIKTNVRATWAKPNVTVSEDGYIMFNNVKSDYLVPKVGAPLASDGPVIKIGEDGYYYISKLYYSSLYTNSTRGGNANSVGIESCVNSGSDYLLTVRKTAKLVAELCMKHNVPLNCVLQHNTTSGKDCPNAMRSTDFWYTFKDMVNMEIFAKTYLTNYEFIWTGISDIDNTGVISRDTTSKEVTYSVLVKKDGTEFLNKTYTTKIN